MPTLHKHNGQKVVNGLSLSQVNEMYLDCGEALEIDVRLMDRRHITDQQRKFIFALCNEISYYTGDDKEYIRLLMQQYNSNLRGIEVESLSTCSMTYANGLIDTIINFCIDREIPFAKELIIENGYTFDEKQTYAMALKRVCVICGQRADIHHVDHIGMGNDRNKIRHIGKKALPLCRKHHTECHIKGNEFYDMYHLTPFMIDKKMEFFIKNKKLRVFDND